MSGLKKMMMGLPRNVRVGPTHSSNPQNAWEVCRIKFGCYGTQYVASSVYGPTPKKAIKRFFEQMEKS